MMEVVIVMSGRDVVTLLSISPHCQCSSEANLSPSVLCSAPVLWVLCKSICILSTDCQRFYCQAHAHPLKLQKELTWPIGLLTQVNQTALGLTLSAPGLHGHYSLPTPNILPGLQASRTNGSAQNVAA